MNTALIVIAALIAIALIAWAILALLTHIVGKRFDRRWSAMSPEERRRAQESAYKSRLMSQSVPVGKVKVKRKGEKVGEVEVGD